MGSLALGSTSGQRGSALLVQRTGLWCLWLRPAPLQYLGRLLLLLFACCCCCL